MKVNSKYFYGTFILAIIGMLFISGCAQKSDLTTTTLQPETSIKTQQGTMLQTTDRIDDKGDFKIIYDLIENPDFIELENVFKESKLFEEITAGLNENIVLPYDIPVVFGECGETNAFYDPEDKQIIMCYELITSISESFIDEVETEEELGNAIIDTTLFIFYHELGHTFIDIYALPTTGKEEDAVDQLSTLILAESGEAGEDAVLHGAVFFFKNSENTKLSESIFADEHPLDRQRFYNLLCWIYGKNPQRHSYLVDEELLPTDRAERCEAEYQQLSTSWDKLLSKYMK